MINLKSVALAILLLSIPAVTLANSNPCDLDCVKGQIATALAGRSNGVSGFTRISWESACPSGSAGLLQGCFINAASAASSAIGSGIKTAFAMFNASPTSVDSAVYVKKFPPGYQFTATDNGHVNTAVSFNADALPSTTRVICDVFLENGTQPDYSVNNDPASSISDVYVVFFDPAIFLGGSSSEIPVLDFTPGTGTATLSAVPFYAVCLGLNTATNAPVALTGLTVT